MQVFADYNDRELTGRAIAMLSVPFKQRNDFWMIHFARPGERLCPRFGIWLVSRRAACEKKFDNFLAAPAAGPAERRRFQQVVAAR